MNKIYVRAGYGFREDTLENWIMENPVLEKGEPSIVRNPEKDGEWLKIGDGVTAWNDLPWKKGPKGDTVPADPTYNPESENAQSGKAVAEAVGNKMDKFGDVAVNDSQVVLYVDDGSKTFRIETTQAGTTIVSGGQLILNDKGGGVIFSGVSDIDFQHRKLTNVADPAENADAATKGYVRQALGLTE